MSDDAARDAVAGLTEADWKATIQQSKHSDLPVRLAALQHMHEAVRSHPDGALDAATQPLLVNALINALHSRSATADEANAAASASRTALVALGLLLDRPVLLQGRVGIIVRKLDEFRGQQQKSRPELIAAIDALFAAHAGVVAAALAESAAAPQPASGAATAATDGGAAAAAVAADRKAARLEKEQRKQADAAEKRRLKAAQLFADQAAAAAASPSDAAPGAAMGDLQPLVSALPASDVRDGTESAPFGNFHNYYFHNAVQERLQYVPSQLAAAILHRKSHHAGSSSALSAGSAGDRFSFSFLDVGCNEGDLTIGLLKHLLAGVRGESDVPTVAEVDARMAQTMAAAAAAAAPAGGSGASASASGVESPSAAAAFQSSTPAHAPYRRTQFHAIGVDIDPELIGRAQSKVAPALSEIGASLQVHDEQQHVRTMATPLPTLCFDTVDVMQPDALQRICGMLASAVAAAAAAASACAATSPPLPALPSSTSSSTSPSSRPFDLVCCYSITLWIHLHHGDEGLRRFLSSLASLTTDLVLEPQPWSCYRNARERWRRCGLADPPALQQLQWRQDVQQRIIDFLTGPAVGMRLRGELGQTKWRRTVMWFERSDSVDVGGDPSQ